MSGGQSLRNDGTAGRSDLSRSFAMGTFSDGAGITYLQKIVTDSSNGVGSALYLGSEPGAGWSPVFVRFLGGEIQAIQRGSDGRRFRTLGKYAVGKTYEVRLKLHFTSTAYYADIVGNIWTNGQMTNASVPFELQVGRVDLWNLAALRERRTNRNISAKKLPPQVLSNLLWAAFGVNRSQASFGKTGRTAASASNYQEIDLYDRNIGNPEVQKSYYYVATGLIASNVFLVASSQGLAARFHNCNRDATAKECKSPPDQRVLFAQTVGYPA